MAEKGSTAVNLYMSNSASPVWIPAVKLGPLSQAKRWAEPPSTAGCGPKYGELRESGVGWGGKLQKQKFPISNKVLQGEPKDFLQNAYSIKTSG